MEKRQDGIGVEHLFGTEVAEFVGYLNNFFYWIFSFSGSKEVSSSGPCSVELRLVRIPIRSVALVGCAWRGRFSTETMAQSCGHGAHR